MAVPKITMKQFQRRQLEMADCSPAISRPFNQAVVSQGQRAIISHGTLANSLTSAMLSFDPITQLFSCSIKIPLFWMGPCSAMLGINIRKHKHTVSQSE